MCSPACQYSTRAACDHTQNFVVQFAHGIGDFQQTMRVGRPIGEDVQHDHAVVAHALGSIDAALDRRVVLGFVGGRWVKPAERQQAPAAIRHPPAPPERVAMPAIRAEHCAFERASNHVGELQRTVARDQCTHFSRPPSMFSSALICRAVARPVRLIVSEIDAARLVTDLANSMASSLDEPSMNSN